MQKDLFQYLGEVMQEVPAVGDLSRLRSTIVNTLPADGGALTADYLHAGALAEPLCDGPCRVPFEEIHYPVALEVHEDGARGVAFSETEVIHAQHPHVLGFGTMGTPDTIQESVGAHEQTQFVGEPGSRFASESESDPLQGLPLTVGATGVDAGHLIQALGEDPALAGGLVAEELAHSNPKAHRCTAPR